MPDTLDGVALANKFNESFINKIDKIHSNLENNALIDIKTKNDKYVANSPIVDITDKANNKNLPIASSCLKRTANLLYTPSFRPDWTAVIPSSLVFRRPTSQSFKRFKMQLFVLSRSRKSESLSKNAIKNYTG